MNDIVGLCSICNRPSRNLNTCQSCGAVVCPKHYDSKSGMCTNCLKGKIVQGKT